MLIAAAALHEKATLITHKMKTNNNTKARAFKGAAVLITALDCGGNQLSTQALTQLLTDLPVRDPDDGAKRWLYVEGNHRDFTAPQELKNAFQLLVLQDAKNY